MTTQPAAPPLPDQTLAGDGQPPSSLMAGGFGVQPVKVITPSGQTLEVLGPGEAAFYVGQAKRYQDENAFRNTSDLLDLDRLVFYELRIFRMSLWLGSGVDYDGGPVDTRACQVILKETSGLASSVKNDLGLTKSVRDKSTQQDVADYLENLRIRAAEFGVLREKQSAKSIELIKQLFAIVAAFDRSDEVERGKLGFKDSEAVLDWVRTMMKPEFDALDAHFRSKPGGQRYWVRSL